MEFVVVKGGCYQMGDTFGDGRGDEKPVHEVCVDDFYIGKYEVTQGQWQAVMGNNPQGPSSGEYRVLRGGSWNNKPDSVRASRRRNNNTPGDRDRDVGFRLLRTK